MLRTSSRSRRGVTLLETMVALTLLLIGVVGFLQMQVYSLYSDQGARAKVRAQELARELTAALLRVDADSPLLTPASTSPTMPANFGKVLDPTSTGWVSWSDSTHAPLLPGVIQDASLEPDPLDTTKPLYQRRWAVWQLTTTNSTSNVRMVAVAVVYHERQLARSRAVILYSQVTSPGASAVNAAAYR
jgi:prepilin-type N-terminal cleavage/methylation domain-containing protein